MSSKPVSDREHYFQRGRAFRNFHQNVVTSQPCERNRNLHIDGKGRPHTDIQ
jgi:hypothetical protein